MLERIMKSNKGFTLVELIVTLAVFSIFLTVAGRYLFLGNNLFITTEVHNTEKFVGDSVFSFMKTRLLYAGKIEILKNTDDAMPTYENAFKIDNDVGQLLQKRGSDTYNNIYGEGFYNHNSVSYETKIADDGQSSSTFELKVKVYDKDGNIVYETGEIIKNLNLVLNASSSIEIKNLSTSDQIEGYYINPIISYANLSINKDKAISIPTDVRDASNKLDKLLADFIAEGKTLAEAKTSTDWYEWVKSNPNSTNNDQFREYVKNKYYGGSWPIFPGFSDSIRKTYPLIDKYLEEHSTLYIQNYIYMTNPSKQLGEERSFVIVNEKEGNSWAVPFIFDHETKEWFVTTKRNWNGTSISPDSSSFLNKPWSEVKEILRDTSKWEKINM